MFKRAVQLGQVPLILGPSSWGAGGVPIVISTQGVPPSNRSTWTRIQVEDWVSRTTSTIEKYPDCRRPIYDELKTWLEAHPERSAVYSYAAGDPQKLNEIFICAGNRDRALPMVGVRHRNIGQLLLTTTAPSTPMEVQKSQEMRLLDVLVLGPFMIGMALMTKPAPVFRALLAAAGAGTILYNLQNYLRTRDQASK